MWATPPLARRSSVPPSRSSIRPNSSALAWRSAAKRGIATQGDHDDDRDRREEADRRADARVDREQQRERAEQQQSVADQVDDQAGEEVAERSDVAVGALDQLAGAVAGVERRVEPQDMERQVGAQPVGGGQADVLGDVDLAELGELEGEGDAEEEDGDAQQGGERRAGGRVIDEEAEDARVGELQPDCGAEQ